jgi:peptidoglycan/LPS O-acetylase OafA/YrhL
MILTESDLDGIGGKLAGTGVSFALFSLTGMFGINLTQSRPRLSALGYLTAAVSLAAFLALSAVIWLDGSWDDKWRLICDIALFALGCGHASLLLGSTRENDSRIVRRVRAALLLALVVLYMMAIAEISANGENVGARPIAVVAVLYVLGTILLPLLRRSMPRLA